MQQPVSRDPSETGGIVWRALLLIVSGTAALIYQVLWIKQLTLIVGVDVYAVTTGVSAFFAGLALGGLLLGRFVDRVQRPLRVYATLEMGVALVGVPDDHRALPYRSPFRDTRRAERCARLGAHISHGWRRDRF